MSAEVETPSGITAGTSLIRYRLYYWEPTECPVVQFSYSTDGVNFSPATMGEGGDGTEDLQADIGGSSHTYAWSVDDDLENGAGGAFLRVKPVPESPVEGAYDTVFIPLRINFQPQAAPTPAGYVKDYAQPYGTQGWRTFGWR